MRPRAPNGCQRGSRPKKHIPQAGTILYFGAARDRPTRGGVMTDITHRRQGRGGDRGKPAGLGHAMANGMAATGARVVLASPETELLAEIEAQRQEAERQALSGVKFGDYHALVIGINDYRNLPKLKTARPSAPRTTCQFITPVTAGWTRKWTEATGCPLTRNRNGGAVGCPTPPSPTR